MLETDNMIQKEIMNPSNQKERNNLRTQDLRE